MKHLDGMINLLFQKDTVTIKINAMNLISAISRSWRAVSGSHFILVDKFSIIRENLNVTICLHIRICQNHK